MFEELDYGDAVTIPYYPGLTKRINIHAAIHGKVFARDPTTQGLVVRRMNDYTRKQKSWPFRFMAVGDVVVFPEGREKVSRSASSFGEKSGMKFKTKRQADGSMMVTRFL